MEEGDPAEQRVWRHPKQEEEAVYRTGQFLILIALVLVFCIPAVAEDLGKENEVLLGSTSPFEDLVEFALAGNDGGIMRALAAADRQAVAVKAVLPAEDSEFVDKRLQTAHKAATARNYRALAAAGLEIYRLLVDHLQADTLKVPKEVSLLDYAGFNLRVLGASDPPDWDAMRKTAADAVTWWRAIRRQVSNVALRDAFSSTVGGLQEATRSENLPMLHFAVQMDLDLVDLLERHFEGK